ncbi:MAG: NADH-quinone oxidoreductase subunit L [Chloroflexi bacterium HGW-Chloroflexi-2]|jgi:multicomponent Na+:H+ antiporter subunit A|nr:MAG: NADH-quinone oxidoreductase subunit L [Chloroflexi bacterium HGW-Chloroflexi-2]
MTALSITILTGFLIAILAPFLTRLMKHRAAFVLALYPLAVVIQLLALQPDTLTAPSIQFPWVPSMGLWMTFTLDGLGFLIAMLIAGIGTLVILYGGEYLRDDPYLERFFLWVIIFMASMLGVVTSGNALVLFVFWELTSISSFFLIGYKFEYESARAAAWQALLVTGAGGLAMLAGFVLLGQITGSFEINQWMQNSNLVQESALAPAAFILILLGAMTKSAQFPFHFWLPNAMEAPTPVSAYLHSATMVKAGVYLLARLFPVLGGLALWNQVVPWVGLLTLVGGALLALGQTDLKKLLAYTTVSSLGGMVFLLGLGTPLAVKSAMLFLLTHALYKGTLFLVAGGVDHSAGSRDIRKLGKLAKLMPFTALAAGLAALSMAGIPPLIGFISKEYVYESTYYYSNLPFILTGLAVLANVANVAVAGWVGIRPFWQQPEQKDEDLHPHKESLWLWIPPLVLAITGLFMGVFSQGTAQTWVAAATSAVLQEMSKVKLSLWHGITPMLLLSVLTLMIGVVVYLASRTLIPRLAAFWNKLSSVGPNIFYSRSMRAFLSVAGWQTKILQSGYLRYYIITILVTTVTLAVVTLATRYDSLPNPQWTQPRFYDVIFIVIIIVSAILVTRAESRLATITLLGAIGFSIAILFLLYSAPDLAMVQFAVETLTVVLFVLVIYQLPKYTKSNYPIHANVLHIIVSAAGGIMMVVLMLLTSAVPSNSTLAPYFMESSLPLAKGHNVVNVILVDFRGLDTLGEITVLMIAAIGVFALLGLKKGSKRGGNG